MSKSNRTPSNMKYNYDDEVNIGYHPFYRHIPIEKISEKQKQMISRHKIVQVINQEPHYSIPEPEPLPERHNNVSPSSPIESFSSFEEEDDYQSKIKALEEMLEDLKKKVDKNAEFLEGQTQAINVNAKTLEDQAARIVSTNDAIQHNSNFIQQQLQAFAHNNNVLYEQTHYINSYNYNIHIQKEKLDQMNIEIEQKQTQLNELQTQLDCTQEQIDSTQQQLDSYQQQITYHGTMLGAFNTLVQNPQYFSQLMSFASGINPDTQNYQINQMNPT
jgi:DNA repair exonuclease SbcCD ATPase subunit